ncbi:MAG: site-2 protease family protein [Candidatus Bathyarchaeia archaeon]
MKYSFKIGSVWGIPVELHITFILLLIIVAFFSAYYFLLIVCLFFFVTIHELSHSVVAKHYHIKVRKIVLYPIGGVSEIEEIPEKPGIEWRMAAAGPLVSFAIGLFLLVIDQLIPIKLPFAEALPFVATARSLIYDLAILNLILGGFNLIPAFPMDGGRILRAFLAEKMKFSDATKYAAFIGKILGILMALFGIWYNLWLVIIGIFIYIGATEETESTIVSTTIARVRVKDVMYSEVASVKPETTLSEALEVMFKARYHDVLVEKDGVFQGIVTWNEIMKVKQEQRNQLRVEQLPMKQISVFSDESILEAYKVMLREKIDLVPVVERETPGKVIGVVTSEGVAYAYEKAKALR